MAGLAVPVIEAAAQALGPILARAGAALLGGAVVGATGSLSGDTKKEDSKAADRSLPRTDRKCDKCPPEGGAKVRRNHGVNWNSYQYQARITGFAPYTEWNFGGVDFDGFRSSQCLLQEAKARYDQFFDPETGEPKFFFGLTGAPKIATQGRIQNAVVATNAPAKLSWYFMQPLSYRYFARRFARQAPLIRTFLQP